MKQELKLPAQCALIPPEEQQFVSGGAPEWMKEFVADTKEKLRPYKPYFDYGWRLLMTTMACVSEIVTIYDYGKIMTKSLKEIKDILA